MLAQLPAASGTYVLILRSRDRGTTRIGRLGRLDVRPGFYVYVGSAFGPGGLRARLSRHLLGTSKPHWHIDYLRRRAEPVAVWFQPDSLPREHRWAKILGRLPGIEPAYRRFGASDCRCETHLFFSEVPPSLEAFRRRLRSAGLSRLFGESGSGGTSGGLHGRGQHQVIRVERGNAATAE